MQAILSPSGVDTNQLTITICGLGAAGVKFKHSSTKPAVVPVGINPEFGVNVICVELPIPLHDPK